MKLTTTMQEVQYAASICLKCGCCTYSDWPENQKLCSLFYQDECFTNCAGGIMSIVTALAENLLTLDNKVAELIYTCASCLNCDSRCSIIKSHPPQVEMIDMIRLLRYEAVKKGLVPTGIALEIQKQAKNSSDSEPPYTLKLDSRIQNEKADAVMFVDYNQTTTQNDILDATASLLKKIGSPVKPYLETGCSGAALYDYGFWDQVESQMKGNWEKMKPLKEKNFVFTDPHSQEFVAKRYPENLEACSEVKVQHISEVIAEALKNGKISSKKSDKIKVSYHDPCYLGRGMGIYEAPREAILSLDNVELVEMKRNRQSSYCCGARIAGNQYSNHAQTVSSERLNDFFETDADILITACSYCKQNLQKAIPEGKQVIIKDITEFVNERV